MTLLERIPTLDDKGLANLLENARRLHDEGTPQQQAQAAELIPALEEASAARKAEKLEAAAAKRAQSRKPAKAKAKKAA